MSILRDAARTLWPPAGDRHGPLVPMLVVLSFVTGLVDAASYLKLGRPGARVGRRAIAIAAMLLGAVLGGLLALRISVASDLALAAGLVLAVALAVHLSSRSDATWTRA